MKKRLLLHVCCAPCAVYVVEKLSKEYSVTLFFYNPNIHPEQEYRFREKEIKRIAAIKNWDVIIADYPVEEWFNRVKGFEEEPERGKRCSLCFNIRLRKTFEVAKKLDFPMVTSTLSISPYKSTPQINEEGETLSKEFGIEFLPENFKKQDGFNKGKKMAMDLEIKHQNYCGCLYSLADRKQKEKKQP